MTDSADYNGPTEDEKREALKPGSEFWRQFNEYHERELKRAFEMANHPTIVAAQEQLRELLLKSAREMPEVKALVWAARNVLKGDLVGWTERGLVAALVHFADVEEEPEPTAAPTAR